MSNDIWQGNAKICGLWRQMKRAHRGAPFSDPMDRRVYSAGWPMAVFCFFSCDALIEIRIGRTTNNARPTTMKFMIAATANTLCQLPV